MLNTCSTSSTLGLSSTPGWSSMPALQAQRSPGSHTDKQDHTLKYPLLNWEGVSERVTDYKFLSYLTKPGSYLPVVQAGLHLLKYCTCLEDNVIFRVDKYKLRLIYYIYPRTFLWTFSLHYVCLVSPSNRSLNL